MNIAQASAEHGGNVARALVSTGHEERDEPVQRRGARVSQDKQPQRDHEGPGERRRGEAAYRRYQSRLSASVDRSSKDRCALFGAIELLKEKKKSFTVNSGQPQFYGALAGTFPTNYLRRKYFGPRRCADQPVAEPVRRATVSTGSTSTAKAAAAPARRFSGTYVQSPRDTTVTGHNWVISNSSLNELARAVVRRGCATRLDLQERALWQTPGAFPAERFALLHAGLQLPEPCTGVDQREHPVDQPLRDQGRLHVARVVRTELKFGGAHERFISPEDYRAEHRHVDVRATDQFFDGIAGSDREADGPADVHRLVPGTMRERAQQYWFNELRAGRVERPNGQSDAQPRRAL